MWKGIDVGLFQQAPNVHCPTGKGIKSKTENEGKVNLHAEFSVHFRCYSHR